MQWCGVCSAIRVCTKVTHGLTPVEGKGSSPVGDSKRFKGTEGRGVRGKEEIGKEKNKIKEKRQMDKMVLEKIAWGLITV